MHKNLSPEWQKKIIDRMVGVYSDVRQAGRMVGNDIEAEAELIEIENLVLKFIRKHGEGKGNA